MAIAEIYIRVTDRQTLSRKHFTTQDWKVTMAGEGVWWVGRMPEGVTAKVFQTREGEVTQGGGRGRRSQGRGRRGGRWERASECLRFIKSCNSSTFPYSVTLPRCFISLASFSLFYTPVRTAGKESRRGTVRRMKTVIYIQRIHIFF